MKRLLNRINIGNALLPLKIAIAVLLIMMVIVPEASVQGVSTELTVNADPIVIGFSSLTSSPNPSIFADTVTFTAVLSASGGAPTGKVVFVELVMAFPNYSFVILGEDEIPVQLEGDSYEYTFSTSTLTVGNHLISVGYDDGSGVVSLTISPIVQVVVDQIWPTVTITSAPPQTTYSTQASLEFSSNTEDAVFECSLFENYGSGPDYWTWSPCESPQVYTDLSFGHVYYFAVKTQGAPITESTMAMHQWYIGLPQITITGGPAEVTDVTEITLTFSSNPADIGMVCSLFEYVNNSEDIVVWEQWVPCTSPRTYTGLSHGKSYYFAVKSEGISDDYLVSRTWTIPGLTLTASPNPSEFGSNVTFTATLWDESGIEPAGTVSFMKMVNMWPGIPIPEFFGTGSGPTASGTGMYEYTFSTSELAIGFHNIIALYSIGVDNTIASLSITQEVTEVTAQAPVITTQPANYTTCAGSSVSFTAAASGTPVPTMQWQISIDGGTTWNNISGATTATYTFTAAAGDNGRRYRVVFTNSAGSATSSAAILIVNSAPSVTTQPANKTVTYGVPGATFSAAASGTAPSVQWHRSTDGTTWQLVSGATSSNLTIANPTVIMSGTRYRAQFNNVCGTATSSAATLTVNKAPVTATAGSYNGTYDGVTHLLSACAVTGTYSGGLDCTNDLSSVGPGVGSGNVTPVIVLNGETEANFTITPQNGSWEITPATVTATGGDYSGTYDGATHSPSSCEVAGVYTGDLSCTNSPSLVGSDVGSGVISPVVNGTDLTNYAIINIDGSWEITPATVTATSGDYSGTYDGDTHSPLVCEVAGVYTGDLSCTNDPSLVGPDVGSGIISPVVNGTDLTNYTIINIDGSWEITPANPICSINDYTGVYDGDPHGAFGSCTGVKAEILDGLTFGDSFTNVPGGIARWTFTDATGNYSDDSGTANIVISKAVATIVVAGYEEAYDGQPHGATLTSATGVNSEDLSGSVIVGTDTFTNVPGGTVDWNFEHNNYESQNGTVGIVISKAVATIVVAGYEKPYDGQPHGATLTSATGVNSEDLSGSVIIGTDTFTNVPGGTVDWSFEHNNYESQNGTVGIVIIKATLIITADDQTAQYSDASPEITFTYSGFIGSEGPDDLTTKPSCSTTREIMSPAGGYPITCAGAFDNNYTFSYLEGTFTVTKESAGITYTGDTQVTTAKVGAKASVTFAAVLEESQDNSLGNQLTGQVILFEVFTFGNTTTPVASCTATIDQVVEGRGYGSCTLILGAADPYQVEISLVTNDFYKAAVESIVVLVNDPGTGMANGGGWLIDPNTNSRVSFGFTIKFLKNGRVQGNNLFIYRVTTDLSAILPGAPQGERDYNWIVKSNAMQGLNIYDCPIGTTSGCKATITGKNTIQAVDRETGLKYSLGGNYQFQVDVTDNQEPGSSGIGFDQYAIRVWENSGTYYELGNSYNDNGMLISPLDIGSGNIQVKAKK